jgi:hypothetical protein
MSSPIEMDGDEDSFNTDIEHMYEYMYMCCTRQVDNYVVYTCMYSYMYICTCICMCYIS